MATTTTTVPVMIEGRQYALEDRPYTGAELRSLAGLTDKDKLVREGADGTESPVLPGRQVHPVSGDSYFVSVRFRRG